MYIFYYHYLNDRMSCLYNDSVEALIAINELHGVITK